MPGSLLVAAVLAVAPGPAAGVKAGVDVWSLDRERILRAAAAAMRDQPVTVSSASSPRSAGGLHDYFSEADYWWPDPDHPGGAYLQRDGMSNPDNFDEHRRAMRRLSVDVPALVNTTIPFTRFLAGAADYTPVVFGDRRKDTTWAHQIATAVVFTSPVLVYGGHPQSLLDNPAADVIKSIPGVWDETRVLRPSAIGELAVYARRRGGRWFLGVLNGKEPRTLRVPSPSWARGATMRPSWATIGRTGPRCSWASAR